MIVFRPRDGSALKQIQKQPAMLPLKQLTHSDSSLYFFNATTTTSVAKYPASEKSLFFIRHPHGNATGLVQWFSSGLFRNFAVKEHVREVLCAIALNVSNHFPAMFFTR